MNKIRQVAPTIDGIREDHVERYRFAANTALDRGCGYIIDIGCGVGYGANLLASETSADVLGVDRDAESIEYAKRHYQHPNVTFNARDMMGLRGSRADMVVMFEVIEHLPGALDLIEDIRADFLVGSVPNEDFVPFVPGKVNAEHYRHFTPQEITECLARSGWSITYMGYQEGKRGDEAKIKDNPAKKRTIVFVAERA